MKLARNIAALWCAACGFLSGQTTVAYEGFDYLKGGCLAGGATGSGWSGVWAETGEGGSASSELILGPGSFPVPPGSPATTGHHVDLNRMTGERRITRRMEGVLGGGSALMEHAFRFVLDCGSGAGVDYAGIELSHSAGGPVVFLGKPAGAGPGNPGVIGMDVYGQGFTGTGVAGSGQKSLCLKWSSNPSGPETLTLFVFDAASGNLLGSSSQLLEASFNQVTLVARRDLAFGNSIPAFDELRASTGTVPTYMLSVASQTPPAGAPISISPVDLNGSGAGNTSLERVYPVGASVTLTAPATVDGNIFLKWTLSGADFSTRRMITVTMTENRSLTAIYQTPVRTLLVSATGVGGPVEIGVSPPDLNQVGGGAAPILRAYASGTVVFLSTPSIVAGARFERWMANGSPLSENPSVQVSMNADLQLTAVYDYPLDEAITGVSIVPEGVRITWSSIGGRSYVVEASVDLQVFSPICGEFPVVGQGRMTSDLVEPLSHLPAKRFYRIRIIDH